MARNQEARRRGRVPQKKATAKAAPQTAWRSRAKSESSRTRKHSGPSDDKLVSFKIHVAKNDEYPKQVDVVDTLADPLSIRLDLFRNTQPLPFQFEAGKVGGNSPTTAMVDLFAPENFGSDHAAGGLTGLDFLDDDIDDYDFEAINDNTSDMGTETCNSGETTPSGSPQPLASRGRINTNNAFPKKHPLPATANVATQEER